MNSPSITAIAFRFIVTASVGLGTIWLSLGQMAAEKIATTVAMPVGILWLLLLFSASYAVAIRQRAAGVLLIVCWLLLSVSGSGLLADRLAVSLERAYLTIQPLEEKPFDVVVVLGGGGGLGANSRIQGNGSGDRMILAAQLYHQGLAKKLVCTGQRIESMDSSGVDPGEVSRTILKGLGVPENAIELEAGRNTSEEMQSLGKKFADGELRIGLVTSAWHLPRALRLAARNDFHPLPLPADFRSNPTNNPPTPGQLIESLVPTAGSLSLNAALLKEYLGMAVGR